MYYRMRRAKATASRTINGKPTKLIKILDYLHKHGPSSKYEIVTKVLGKKGNRKELRGYYSDNMQIYRESGLIELNYDTKEYSITERGVQSLKDYPINLKSIQEVQNEVL